MSIAPAGRGRAALLLCALAAVGAAHDEYDPYQIPAGEFRTRVRTIALAPFIPAPETPKPLAQRREVESALAAALSAHGYEVLPSLHFEALWREFSLQLGGVYDPATGVPDPSAEALAREFTLRELAAREGVDAVLASSLRQHPLPSYVGPSPRAPLHGIYMALDEPLIFEGEVIQGHPSNKPQRVVGHALEIEIHDLVSAPLYAVACPTQWTHVYVARGYSARPPAELHDRERVMQAVVTCTSDLAPTSGAPHTPVRTPRTQAPGERE